jgi:hypothetical protein
MCATDKAAVVFQYVRWMAADRDQAIRRWNEEYSGLCGVETVCLLKLRSIWVQHIRYDAESDFTDPRAQEQKDG